MVVLRGLVPQDADVLAEWAQDEVFRRAAGWSDLSYEEHRAKHLRRLADPPDDLVRLGALQDGRLVGYVDLQGVEPHRRELGYLVGPRARWGRGLGLAIARAGLCHGFEELGLQELWAEALAANVASVRILQRLGMTETGRGDGRVLRAEPGAYRRFTIRREREPAVTRVDGG